MSNWRTGKYQMAWIDQWYAEPGKEIRIKVNGEWYDGWKVDEVYGTLDPSQLLIVGEQYKHTREVSDI